MIKWRRRCALKCKYLSYKLRVVRLLSTRRCGDEAASGRTHIVSGFSQRAARKFQRAVEAMRTSMGLTADCAVSHFDEEEMAEAAIGDDESRELALVSRVARNGLHHESRHRGQVSARSSTPSGRRNRLTSQK